MVFNTTAWQYDTSREFSTAIAVFTGGEGEMRLLNPAENQKLNIGYSFLAAGVSKGSILNIAESLTTDTSGGLTNVKVMRWLSFGPDDIPCKGWAIQLGATAGIFQPSFMSQSGISAAVFLFGAIPWGGIVVWGRFNSIMPSAGPSIAFVEYHKQA